MRWNDVLKELNTELGPSRTFLGHFEWRITTALPIIKLTDVILSNEIRLDEFDIILLQKAILN